MAARITGVTVVHHDLHGRSYGSYDVKQILPVSLIPSILPHHWIFSRHTGGLIQVVDSSLSGSSWSPSWHDCKDGQLITIGLSKHFRHKVNSGGFIGSITVCRPYECSSSERSFLGKKNPRLLPARAWSGMDNTVESFVTSD